MSTHPDDHLPPRPRPAEHPVGQDDDPPDLGLLLLVLARVLEAVHAHLEAEQDGRDYPGPGPLKERVGAAYDALARFISHLGSLP